MQLTLQDDWNKVIVQGSVKKAMGDVGAKSRDLWQVPLADIRKLDGFNVRVRDEAYLAHLRSIANSIRTNGFWPSHPLEGYVANEGGSNVIYLTGGYTRFEATLIANSEGAEIPCLPMVIAPQGTSIEDLTIALIKGNEGKPLTPYECGVVCKRLINFGWDTQQIAARLDLSTVYIDGLLMLVAAPNEIRMMVQSGQVSATMAIQALRDYGSETIRHLETGLAKAKASGGHRVTSKHMPFAAFNKAVKSSAPVLFSSIRDITQDPGYSHLSGGLRTKIDELLSKLTELEEQGKAETSTDEKSG